MKRYSMRSIIIPLIISTVLFAILKFYDIRNPVFNLTNEAYIGLHMYTKPIGELDTNIFIVNIRDFPEDVIKDQLEILSYYSPKVIGLDYILLDSVNLPNDTLIDYSNLVLPSLIDSTEGKYFLSLNPYTTKAHYGFVNINGTTYFNTVNKDGSLSFASAILKLYDNNQYIALTQRSSNREIINYNGNTFQFNYLGDLTETSPEILEKVTNRIVLMGYLGTHIPTSQKELDSHFTPYGKMYGVVLIANMIHTIMLDNYINQAHPAITTMAAFFVGILSTLFVRRISRQKLAYLYIKLFQVALVFLLFYLSYYTIRTWSYALEYHDLCFIVIIVPEVAFWYNKLVRFRR